MQKLIFDSTRFPGDDRVRKEAWIDTLATAVARLSIDPLPGRRFEGRLEVVPLHGGAVCTVGATVRSIEHATADIVIDGQDTVVLMLSTSQETLRLSQRDRDVDVAPGEAVLFDQTKATTLWGNPESMTRVIGIRAPRELVRRQLRRLEDRFLLPVRASTRALSLARAYVDALVAHHDPADSHLNQLAMSHVADLIAAAAAPAGAAADEASAGQRAARLLTIRREIDRSFDDPDFSLTMLAQRLGVTPRYIQALLSAGETSFVDEVVERRLRRARDLLISPLHAHLSVIEIAHECGFSTVSHFHRTFRRRFGTTPADLRRQSC